MLYNFNSSPNGRVLALSLEILPETCWAQDEEWAFVTMLQENSCINHTDHAEFLPAWLVGEQRACDNEKSIKVLRKH